MDSWGDALLHWESIALRPASKGVRSVGSVLIDEREQVEDELPVGHVSDGFHG